MSKFNEFAVEDALLKQWVDLKKYLVTRYNDPLNNYEEETLLKSVLDKMIELEK